jgi:hypothetical protein
MNWTDQRPASPISDDPVSSATSRRERTGLLRALPHAAQSAGPETTGAGGLRPCRVRFECDGDPSAEHFLAGGPLWLTAPSDVARTCDVAASPTWSQRWPVRMGCDGVP